jgi:hypothetical protein
MALTLAALKTELQTDPTALGYAPFVATETTWQLAALLNQPRPAIRTFRSDVPTWEVVACTGKAEYDALTAGNKQLYQILVSAGTLDGSDSRIRAMFASIFAAGATRTALAAMAERDGSRAEQLFGVAVTSEDCAKALRS